MNTQEQQMEVLCGGPEEEPMSCMVSPSVFWYVSQMYQEQMEAIEREHGVEITPEVKVSFEVGQSTGTSTPEGAKTAFISLLRHLDVYNAKLLPMRYADPHDLVGMLKLLQKEDTVMLIASAKDSVIWGPCDIFSDLPESLIPPPDSSTDTTAPTGPTSGCSADAGGSKPSAGGGGGAAPSGGGGGVAPSGGGGGAAPSGGRGGAEKCPICLDTMQDAKALRCSHQFCGGCLDMAVKYQGTICPICKDVFGKLVGNQPDGRMSHHRSKWSLPGFRGYGTITIDYKIPGGRQKENHPTPGKHYSGIHRTAYLPDNDEGREVLALLKRAWDQRLIFTIGMSRTTGYHGVVTWNDIHHKTSWDGGPRSYGYPDPDYLSRVKEELKAKGIE